MAVKQVFETYVYAQILSSIDLLPFVIALRKSRAHSNHAPLPRQHAVFESLFRGEGLTQKNAAKGRGVGQAYSAGDQAKVSINVPSISSEALATATPAST